MEQRRVTGLEWIIGPASNPFPEGLIPEFWAGHGAGQGPRRRC